MSRISVIVPVYNVEKYLHRCVDSVLVQTFTDFELILVDDGSPDNCGKICDEYAQKDSRVHVIHKKNGGLSSARNVGIDWAFKESNSEWIAFIDSDDWIHPRYLEVLYNAVVETKLKISACDFEFTEGKNPVVNAAEFTPQICNTELCYCKDRINMVVACMKLYSKECFKSIRFPLGKLHEDEFVFYKIMFKYESIAVVKAPLYAYFRNEKSITGSVWNPKRLVVFDALQEQIDFFYNNGFLNAYKKTIIKYAFILYKHIERVNRLPEYKNYEKKLRKQLRVFLKKYKNDGELSIEKTPWIYNTLYPKTSIIYWVFFAKK